MDEVEVQEDGIVQQAWDHGSYRAHTADQSQDTLPPGPLR